MRQPRTNAPLAAALTAVLALLLTGLSPVSAAAPSGIPRPHHDPFYRYTGDTPLRDIAPGTVLKHRTVQLAAFGQGSTPLEATQLLYRTRNELRKPAVTVTTVVRPEGLPAGGAPHGVVAYLRF
jgi:hypothetical protein